MESRTMAQKKPYHPHHENDHMKPVDQELGRYPTFSRQERKRHYKIAAIMWLVILTIVSILGIIVYYTSGAEALRTWLNIS
jgi:hypothetical protein